MVYLFLNLLFNSLPKLFSGVKNTFKLAASFIKNKNNLK